MKKKKIDEHDAIQEQTHILTCSKSFKAASCGSAVHVCGRFDGHLGNCVCIYCGVHSS